MPKARIKPVTRARKRTWAETVEFPRWIAAAGIVAIGLILLLARLSDTSGNVSRPGLGAILYLASLAGLAAWIVYAGRGRG